MQRPREKEGFTPLNREQRNRLWIDPLLTQLKLVRKTEKAADPSAPWQKIEASRLPDRVGRIAAEINEAAGYHLLETLYYLPPQKNVLCIRFDRNRDKHNMEIALHEAEIVLKFSTSRHVSFGWERYFSGDPLSNNYTVVWEQSIQPLEISDEHVQGWLTYLLSGLNKDFKPDRPVSDATAAESDLSAVLRKASA
jgi:hypothetical protein